MPSISFFKIIGRTIEKSVQVIAKSKGCSPQDIYTELLEHLRENSSEWLSNRQPKIPYDKPFCRLAYLYGIVPVNANLIAHVIELDSSLRDHLKSIQEQNDQVNICAVGGGPGTEILGITKFMANNGYFRNNVQYDLRFLLLDRVLEWVESWKAIEKRIQSELKELYGEKSKWPIY